MAHKKAQGSTANLRDSKPKYRGVKIFGGQHTLAGAVLVRQKGWVYEPGNNVFSGKDYTIHAQTEGVVQFRKKKITRFDGRVYLKTFVDVLTS